VPTPPGPPDQACLDGAAALARGDLEAAARAYRQAIGRGAGDSDAYNNLGVIEAQRGDLDAAIVLFQGAWSRGGAGGRENLIHALATRGADRFGQGRFEEAAADFQERAQLEPAAPRAWTEWGAALAKVGRLEEAIDHHRRAIALAPDYALAHSNLGAALLGLKRTDEAVSVLETACALAPADPNAAINLSSAQQRLGNVARAEELARKALVLAPRSAEAHNNLGLALSAQGEGEEALASLARATALDPKNPGYFSTWLLTLHYDPAATPQAIAAEHRRFQATFGGEVASRAAPPRSSRLRVAYLSPDLRRHSVSYFFEPLLAAHDRNVVEVFCYADVPRPDDVTVRLAGLAEQWRTTWALPDAELAALLERDGVDVLVDLAGHTAGNRMALLARRAAPIQFSYLGYPATTGLGTMDFRVTDAIADPPGLSEGWHSEALVRIEGGFLCYSPPLSAEECPAVVPPPALASGAVTFGSFNNLAKINAGVLDAWAALLGRVPGSRLLLKARGLDHARIRDRLWSRLEDRGVERRRVELVAPLGRPADHLAAYGRVDVALDTFPYNGTTTTCEALWMGVPVVTFTGRAHAGRVGASILSRLGLEELAPATLEESIEEAASLASDRERLVALRGELRERLRASPLMDSARLARQLEAAYATSYARLSDRRQASR
jgi:predicted O-linked N-acetylglucosamine transferase (SPINDLY family)